MCGGVEYEYIDPETGERKSRKVYFPIPQAKLPVLREEADDLSLEFIQWGRRQGEPAEGDVPVTGWARLISLKEGKWNRYRPRRVKIPALRWMEKDGQKQSHWFEMAPNRCILGVEIESAGQKYVYVVTRPSEGEFAAVHDRMPMLTERF